MGRFVLYSSKTIEIKPEVDVTLPIRTRACLRLLSYKICGEELARARAFTQDVTILP